MAIDEPIQVFQSAEPGRRFPGTLQHSLKDPPRMEREWKPIDTLPPPGERPGRVFVIVEGERYHSDKRWLRQHAGIASTWNEGFDAGDIAHLEDRGDMDQGSGRVTHWLPIDLPKFPSRNNR